MLNYCFRKRWLVKRLERLASEHHSVINVLTGSKHRRKYQGITIFLFSHEFQLNWVEKKTALLWLKILILFVNTLTADDKYSCRNMQNFLQQLQTLLSQKRKTLSGFFIAFLKCSWNSKHYAKKDECPSLIISEIIVSERDCYWNV